MARAAGSNDPNSASEVQSADDKYIKSLLRVASFFVSGMVVFGGVAGFLMNSLTTENIDPQVRSIIALSIKSSLVFLGSFTMATLAVVMFETSVVFSNYEKKRFNRIAENFTLGLSVAAAVISGLLFFFSIFYIKPIWDKIGILGG